MSKPEDIPQDVWDAASDEALKYVDWLRPSNPDAEHVLAVSFARAIMAATLAERQRCAEKANGVDPKTLEGKDERWVHIYCTGRVDAHDEIMAED